jgi:tetratricopeptide (TPR) repeat protein
MRLLLQAAMVFMVTLCVGGYASSATQEPKEELSQAIDRQSKGRFDEALVLFKSAAEHAEEQGDRDLATESLLHLSLLLREIGDTPKAEDALIRCQSLDSGTKLEGVCQPFLDLLAVDSRIEGATELTDLLDILQRILTVEKESLAKVSQSWRDPIKNMALTRRVYLYKQFHDVFGSHLKGEKAKALSPPLQIFLVAAMRDVPPKNLDPRPESRKRNLPTALLSKLDAQGSLDKVLLVKTLQLNSTLMELDKADRLALAIDISQRSDIHARLGNVPQAIALKREAVALFYQYGGFENIINALYGLTDLYLAQNSPTSRSKALELSRKQIAEIENQVLAMSGVSAGHLFNRSQNIYNRHFNLLLDRYRAQRSASLADADRTLEDLVLQADRMNFRGVRRDFALYRELSPLISPQSELLQRLTQKREKLIAKQQEWEQIAGEGKIPPEFPLGKGVSIFIEGEKLEGPSSAVQSAKKELTEVLEDYKRTQLGSQNRAVRMPSSLQEIVEGMSPAEALVMYIQRPPPETGTSAVIITERNQVRWVPDLRSSDGKSLGDMIRELQEQIPLASRLESPDMRGALERLSETLWHPLGDLPDYLTIILTPNLIGVPFESLLLKNGKPVISAHRIRYAFGLEPGIGAAHEQQAYRRAFVVGASMENLLEAKKEVDGLRGFLDRQGVAVSPPESTPAEGSPLFYKDGTFDVIHVTTHSGIDRDLRMMDTLKFPHDNIFAYELAFSPARANLMVLSACELFTQRAWEAEDSSLNPVSGITTAVMARVAPQVISTLWNVNAEATRIFMLRFYDALLKHQEPSAALAATKRDFLDPARLKQWVESAGIEPPVTPIEEYKAPYYWAPFLLITRSSR